METEGDISADSKNEYFPKARLLHVDHVIFLPLGHNLR